MKDFQWVRRLLRDYWIEGSHDIKSWNFYKHRGQSSNNHAEGYNFRLNSKINKHPNPYLLAGQLFKHMCFRHRYMELKRAHEYNSTEKYFIKTYLEIYIS